MKTEQELNIGFLNVGDFPPYFEHAKIFNATELLITRDRFYERPGGVSELRYIKKYIMLLKKRQRLVVRGGGHNSAPLCT